MREVGDEGVREALAGASRREVLFNYLGQFEQSSPGGLVWALPDGVQADVSPHDTREHLLDIVGRVEHECLEFTWQYSADLHREATIRRLAEEMMQALRDIIEHCAQPDAGGGGCGMRAGVVQSGAPPGGGRARPPKSSLRPCGTA